MKRLLLNPLVIKNSLRLWCCILCACLSWMPMIAAAQVRAFLDRQQIQTYETVELQIEIDERTGDEPDFSILENDFEVSQTRQSSSVSIVNGQVTATTQWSVTLKPKRQGTLDIPSFTLADQQTLPLKLEVISQPAMDVQDPAQNTQAQLQEKLQNKPPVFLLLEFSNPKPYVQEPVLATLKIYHSVRILQGGLSDWVINNARIQRVPNQTESSDVIDGKTYQITQVHYWITPQQSGPLQLPSLVFQGEVADHNSGLLSPFGGIAGRRISDATPPQALQVRPQPSSYPPKTPWLPAKRVEVQDSWTPSSQQVQVGQAITRHLEVQVTGQWGSLIPEIQYPTQNGLKFYPDQSQPQDQMTPQAVNGRKTLSIAMVPTQTGTEHLPVRTITWWNTQTDQLEHTQIPAASFKVLPAPGQSLPAQPSQTTSTLADNNPVDKAIDNTIDDPDGASTSSAHNDSSNKTLIFWQGLAIALATLWLLTVILFIWMHRRRQLRLMETTDETEDWNQPTPTTIATALDQLKQALADNRLESVERSVILWGQAFFQDPQIGSLSSISQRTQSLELRQQLQALSAKLYNPRSQATSSAESQSIQSLHGVLKNLGKKASPKKRSAKELPLPALYPN